MTSKSIQACSIADVAQGTILARVEIAAPPERVFRALTTDELAAWWGPSELHRTTAFSIDLHAGGAWRSEGVGADGAPFHVGGRVLELDPPRRLVQTWEPSWDADGPPTTVSSLLDAIGTGTRLTIRHAGFGARAASCESHAAGWERALGRLASHVAPRPELRFYLCRLLPSRATFMQDMTADERAVMQAHGGYWRGNLAEGRVIAFGPVADPAGVWGVGIVAVRDEAELRTFQGEDPAIKADIGLRYEALPMIAAVY
ncbi:SRPBCC domain-containing protein [Sorangium sp. So ce542]|uniref:SRPBCC domain-containing protein n=1 Tax=Sorangium sp. So ce542 TaxID=3133316 RepID=UPI003F6024C8